MLTRGQKKRALEICSFETFDPHHTAQTYSGLRKYSLLIGCCLLKEASVPQTAKPAWRKTSALLYRFSFTLKKLSILSLSSLLSSVFAVNKPYYNTAIYSSTTNVAIPVGIKHLLQVLSSPLSPKVLIQEVVEVTNDSHKIKGYTSIHRKNSFARLINTVFKASRTFIDEK